MNCSIKKSLNPRTFIRICEEGDIESIKNYLIEGINKKEDGSINDELMQKALKKTVDFMLVPKNKQPLEKYLEILELLLSYGAPQESIFGSQKENLIIALIKQVKLNSTTIDIQDKNTIYQFIIRLIAHYHFNVNYEDANKRTCIFHLILNPSETYDMDLTLIKILISNYGASVDHIDNFGNSLLTLLPLLAPTDYFYSLLDFCTLLLNYPIRHLIPRINTKNKSFLLSLIECISNKFRFRILGGDLQTNDRRLYLEGFIGTVLQMIDNNIKTNIQILYDPFIDILGHTFIPTSDSFKPGIFEKRDYLGLLLYYSVKYNCFSLTKFILDYDQTLIEYFITNSECYEFGNKVIMTALTKEMMLLLLYYTSDVTIGNMQIGANTVLQKNGLSKNYEIFKLLIEHSNALEYFKNNQNDFSLLLKACLKNIKINIEFAKSISPNFFTAIKLSPQQFYLGLNKNISEKDFYYLCQEYTWRIIMTLGKKGFLNFLLRKNLSQDVKSLITESFPKKGYSLLLWLLKINQYQSEDITIKKYQNILSNLFSYMGQTNANINIALLDELWNDQVPQKLGTLIAQTVQFINLVPEIITVEESKTLSSEIKKSNIENGILQSIKLGADIMILNESGYSALQQLFVNGNYSFLFKIIVELADTQKSVLINAINQKAVHFGKEKNLIAMMLERMNLLEEDLQKTTDINQKEIIKEELKYLFEIRDFMKNQGILEEIRTIGKKRKLEALEKSILKKKK